MHKADITIVGGGMVGLATALACAHTGLNVVVLEQGKGEVSISDAPGLRVSAINGKSQALLRALGAWDDIAAARLQAYQSMRVWDKHNAANIAFHAAESGLDQLGFIIENQVITHGLMRAVSAHKNIQLIAGVTPQSVNQGDSEAFVMLDNGTPVITKYLVAADGAHSWLRKQVNIPLTFKDYDHTAIVTTVELEQGHQNTAWQVFMPQGPLAFLPLFSQNSNTQEANLASIVWSTEPEHAKDLMAMDDSAFSHALTAASDGRLGQVQVKDERLAFPLTMRYARDFLADRVILIGDAAHTIHPLAGQGVNLGFADVNTLWQLLQKDGLNQASLRRYERQRKAEAIEMMAAMEGFKQLFAGNNPVKKLVRGLGLNLVDKLPLLKQQLIRLAMGQ